MAKSVKVHDDTHKALKRLKAIKRSKSLDEVIREMIKSTTGSSVSRIEGQGETQLISYMKT